jgi:hypothetical protein
VLVTLQYSIVKVRRRFVKGRLSLSFLKVNVYK